MEEVRLFENNGAKLTDGSTESYVDVESLYFTCAVNQKAKPITKDDLVDFVAYNEFESDSALIQMIGIDEFWNKYGKPVTKK